LKLWGKDSLPRTSRDAPYKQRSNRNQLIPDILDVMSMD
jgi:hypothetical protein